MSGFLNDNEYLSETEDVILAKMRKEHFEKSLKMQNVVRKSFIMNDQSTESKRIKQNMDSDSTKSKKKR